MRTPRLLWQVFLVHLAILVVLIAGLEWYASRSAREFYTDRKQAELETVAKVSEARLLDLLDRQAYAELQTVCADLAGSVSLRITVILPSGQVVADTSENPQQMDNHADRPEVQAALLGELGRSTRFSHTVGEQSDLRGRAAAAGRQGGRRGADRVSGPVVVRHPSRRVPADRAGRAGRHRAGGRGEPAGGQKDHAAAGSAAARSRTFRPRRIEAPPAGSGAEEIRMLAQSLNHMAAELDQRLETIVRQENEHQAVLSSMVEGVLAVDPEGAILSLNETCAEMLGVDAEQARGRLVHEAIRHAGLLTFVEKALASPEPVEQDLEATGPDRHWLHAHGTVLHDGQQRKIGALIVLHDVTRLRHLEKIRRDFVANVSHELKTPITSIKGFVETLLHEQLEDKDNSLRFLGIILRQVNRLDAIIGDLLMLSRLERGSEEQTIQLQSESLAEVLRAAVEMCEKKAADKQMRLDLDCPADLQAEINAPLLEQAVTNLIDNAIKYSEAGAAVRIAASQQENEVVIRVQDQGCGIEAVHLPRLFERFYRVDRARSRELGGTGLGLAIVKHIVAAHRGSVRVESTVGQGSTFFISLPRER